MTRGSRISITITAFAVLASAVSVSAENSPVKGSKAAIVTNGQQAGDRAISASDTKPMPVGQIEVKRLESGESQKINFVTDSEGNQKSSLAADITAAPVSEMSELSDFSSPNEVGVLDLRDQPDGAFPTIFNAMDYDFLGNFTNTGRTSRALESFWPGTGNVPNRQTYVIKEIILPFSRIVNTAGASPVTYLEFTIGKPDVGNFWFGDVACASNFDRSIDPATEVRILVNTGADANSVCDASYGAANAATDDNDVWRINLVTGNATSQLTGTVFPGVVVQNNSPMPDGSVPVGNGDATLVAEANVVHVEVGILSGVIPNATVAPGTLSPNAGCLAKWHTDLGLALPPAGIPDGQIWLNWSFGAPTSANANLNIVQPAPGENGAGFAGGAISSDNTAFGGDQDGILECNEGAFIAGAGNGTFVNMAFNGSLVPDCNENSVPDNLDIAGTTSTDLNTDNIPDECQLTDCNSNSVPDLCDISCADIVPPNALGAPFTPGLCSANFPGQCGLILDCNTNGVPDDCEADCNLNGIPDDCDINLGGIPDCNGNAVPDSCDIDPNDPDGNGVTDLDCDVSGVPDVCERFFQDCNANGVEDFCDILFNNANDFNGDGTPDACAGNMVTLDFEDATAQGDANYEYVVTESVHDQPAEGEEADPQNPDDQTVSAALDWQTIDFTGAGAFTGATGIADVTAGSVNGGGGVKMLRYFQNFNVAGPFAVLPPHIWFASPDTEVVFGGTTPATHSLSFDIDFPSVGYMVDWDFFFSSIFDTGGNSWRMALAFQTDAAGVRNLVVFHDGASIDTGLDWRAGGDADHNVEIVIDYSTNGFSTSNAGAIFWDGNFVTNFNVRTANGGTRFIDSWQMQNDANTSTVSGTHIDIDNIKLTWSGTQVDCAAYKLANGETGTDCDADGVCDHFQIAASPGIVGFDDDVRLDDLNSNGIPDHCESYCIDCNHNGFPDSFEILNTNGLDNNGNGVLDVCERNTHNNSFEADEYDVADGFATGLIEGQQGWRAILDADGVISDDTGAAGFKTGTQFLIVQDRPGAVGADGIIVGPRQTAIPDADIELWAWDWRTTATGGNIGFVQVEILDLCLDGPAVVGGSGTLNAGPFLEVDAAGNAGAGNVGLRVRPEAGGSGAIDVEMLGISSGARQYSSTTATAVQGDYQSAAGFSAGIEILNRTGRVFGYWESDQSLMDFLSFAQIASEGEHVETQTITSIAQVGVNQRTSGGDSQVLIRISDDDVPNGQFGTGNDAQYWFDNFTYQAFPDCDFDGFNDLLWVENTAAAPGASTLNDMNGDDIPDRCQDCDNDCTWTTTDLGFGPFVRLSSPTACLDPCEINGVASGCSGGGTELDCNGNSIPDNCDIADPADGLSDNGDPSDGYLHIGWYDSGQTCTGYLDSTNGVGCNFFREGGGSGDADANGVPDDCQITGGAADCNENGLVDLGEIAGGTAADDNTNSIPDECEADCNNNGRLDGADVQSAGGNSIDQFPADLVPDECCPSGQGAGDLDGDGDVDAADYLLMQECGSQISTQLEDCTFDGINSLCSGLPGPNGAGAGIVAGSYGGVPPNHYACGCGDINGDGIIDECDMQSFQFLVTGP